MNDTKRLGSRAAVFFGLSVIFFLPALERLWTLTESGQVRRVDLLLILVGGFAAGSLFATAMGAWREKRRLLGS